MLYDLFHKSKHVKLTSNKVDFILSHDVFTEDSAKLLALINKVPQTSMSYVMGNCVKITFRLHFLVAMHLATHKCKLRPRTIRRIDGHKYFDSFIK